MPTTDVTNPPTSTYESQDQLYQAGIGISNVYEIDSGVCVIPLAELPPTDPNELQDWSPVIKLQLHAPYRRRTATYHADKQMAPPVLPSPVDVGAFIFTQGQIIFDPPKLNTSQNGFDWSASAKYVYYENCVSRNIDGMVLGTTGFQWLMSQQGIQNLGGLPSPTYGAIADAGADALFGYALSQDITDQGTWVYPCQSFYPGDLFNDNLFNGGLTSPPPPVG